MSPEARLEELRARLQLSLGTPTLLFAIAEGDSTLEETRRLLLAILDATPLRVADLGACDHETGPARWADLTRSHPAEVFVLTAAPVGPVGGAAFARLLNAERELLRQLAGPVVLVLSRETERALRKRAPDFVTWAAQSYELPGPEELAAIARRLGAAPAEAGPPDEEPIRILHVSDFHLRPDRFKRYDQDRVLRGLFELLERDRAGAPLDLVFVTGDLAHGGKPEEYALVAELLRGLLEVTGVAPERLFVVPGNHDVDREAGRWVLRTLAGDDDAVRFFEEARSRRFHAQKLEAYRNSLSDLLGAGRPLGLGVGAEAVEIVEVRGARLAVASFNSAWFAQGDDDHGKLWLGEAGVDRAAGRIADEGASFAIALLHHPLEDLHPIERDGVERRFERVFDVVLRGHLHQDRTRSIASQRGGFVEVAAPAAYQGSQWPNGCFLGEIRPKARTVRLRPYAYASGADPWVLDPKVFPDDADEGYCHTFKVPEKRRLRSVVARHLARAVEASVEAASPAKQAELAAQLGIAAPEGKLSAEVVQRVASAAQAQVLDAELWTTLDAEEKLGRAFADAGAEELSEAEEAPARISRSDPQFLEKALLEAARIVDQFGTGSRLGQRLNERGVVGAFSAALEAVVDGAVMTEVALPGHLLRPDIMLGGDGEAPELRAVIEVKRSTSTNDPMMGLVQLDRYMQVSGITHGALVLVGARAPGERGPQLQRRRSPAGREVLVLRL